MRDLFAAVTAATLVLVVASAATASRPLQDYLARANAAVADHQPAFSLP